MLGKKLSELRKAKGLSQYELADRLGFSRGKLANYEQGTREPDFDTLSKLADYFEVTADYLIGREEKAPIGKYNNNKDEEDFLKWMNDPTSDMFFKEYIESPEEMKEQLRKIWDIIKQQQK